MESEASGGRYRAPGESRGAALALRCRAGQGRVAGLAHRCAAALLHGVGRKGVAANVRDKTAVAVAVEVEVAAMALPTADAVGLGLGLRYRPQEATGGHGRPQGCSETPVLIAAGASWTCAGGCFHSNLVGAAVQGVARAQPCPTPATAARCPARRSRCRRQSRTGRRPAPHAPARRGQALCPGWRCSGAAQCRRQSATAPTRRSGCR